MAVLAVAVLMDLLLERAQLIKDILEVVAQKVPTTTVVVAVVLVLLLQILLMVQLAEQVLQELHHQLLVHL